MQNDGSVSAVRQFFRNRWVKAILVIDIFAVTAIIGFIIWNNTKTATIAFNVVPLDAKIQLNGQGDYSNGSYQVHPGTYKATISHDGLESKTFNLELKSGYVTTLTTFLKGADDNFEFYTLRDNYGSFEQLSQIASEGHNSTTDGDTSAYNFIAVYQKNLNLYQSSPIINYVDYDVDGSSRRISENIVIQTNDNKNCRKMLCFKGFMALTNDTNFANQLLANEGFNLEYCEVEYEIY